MATAHHSTPAALYRAGACWISADRATVPAARTAVSSQTLFPPFRAAAREGTNARLPSLVSAKGGLMDRRGPASNEVRSGPRERYLGAAADTMSGSSHPLPDGRFQAGASLSGTAG